MSGSDIEAPPFATLSDDERELATQYVISRLTEPDDVLAMLGLVVE